MKQLILNADDLGFDSTVNEAICLLAEKGRISASSFMVYGILDMAHQARLQEADIDIGLHFDLTSPWCPGAQKLSLLIGQNLLGMRMRQMGYALEEQLCRFIDTWQRLPDFIDGHQHVHQFAPVRAVLGEVWDKWGEGRRLRIRNTRPFSGSLKAYSVYAPGGSALMRLCQDRGWLQNHSFGGVYRFDADEPRLSALWAQWLSDAPAHGGLLMCHPAHGVMDSRIAAQDPIHSARAREGRWLLSDAFARLLQAYAVTPVRWSALS